MAAESSVKTTVVYDVSQMKEGSAETVEALQKVAAEATVTSEGMQSASMAMAKAAEEAAERQKAASKGIASATIEDMAAKKELRAVMTQVKQGTGDLESQTILLSEAQQKQSLTARNLAAAQKIAADEQATTAAKAAAAAEIANLAAAGWTASFARIALSAKESLGSVQKKLVETAETAKLTSAGIGSGFAALGGLMGTGIAVGFLSHFADEMARVNVELGHLEAKTGIAGSSLAGLQLIAKESGVDFEKIATGITKFEKSMDAASNDSKPMIEAFAKIGITQADIAKSGHDTEAMLELVSTGFAHHTNQAIQTAVAQALFSKGGAALVPILQKQGEALDANMKKMGASTGVTEQSIAASERWVKNMALVSMEIQKIGNVAIENMHYLGGVCEGVYASMLTICEGITAVILSTANGLGSLGHLLRDAMTMNFAAIESDAKNVATSFAQPWKVAFKDVGDSWKSVAADFKSPTSAPSSNDTSGDPDDDTGRPPKKGRSASESSAENKAAEARLRAMEEERAQLEQQGQLTAKADHDFWAARIDAFAVGSSEYHQIQERITRDDIEGANKAHESLAQFKQDQKKDAEDVAPTLKAGEGMDKMLREQGEDARRSGERWDAYYAAIAKGQEQAAMQAATMEEQKVHAEESAGTISQLGAAQQLAAIHAKAHQIELQALLDELARLQKMADSAPKDGLGRSIVDPKLATQIQNLQNQIGQQKGSAAAQKGQDQKATADAMAKPYLASFNAINSGWLKVQNDLIAGNKRIGQSVRQIALQMTQDLAKHEEERLADYLRKEIRKIAAHRATVVANNTTDATGAATSSAIAAAADSKEGQSAAKKAFKNTYAVVSGWPVVGPILAPVLGAAAFAAVAAFEKGGIVDGVQGVGVPILAHAGERVLTTTQTNNFERMVNNSSTGGGTIHNHFGRNSYSASGSDFKSQWAQHEKHIVTSLKRLHREGKLNFPSH